MNKAQLKSITNVFIFLIIPLFTWGQYNEDAMAETFFVRQPSPRAEAMGRSNVSVGGDLGSVLYNPAGLGKLNGLQVYGSSARPFYLMDNAKYTFVGVGYAVNKYLQFSLMNFRMQGNYGSAGNFLPNEQREFLSSTYSITLSAQAFKNFFVGLNSNILTYNVGTSDYEDTWFFDLGLLYELKLVENNNGHHSINFANSWKNVTQSEAKFDDSGFEGVFPLPSIIYIGMNYNMSIKKGLLIEKVNTFDFLAQIQYQDVFQYEFRDAVSFGGEFKFFEILALRFGYYLETIDDRGFPEDNTNQLSEFTYGLGIQVPLHRFSNIPLDIKFDYTSLEQPSYSKRPEYSEWENFTSYSIGLTWVMNSEKKEKSADPEKNN